MRGLKKSRHLPNVLLPEAIAIDIMRTDKTVYANQELGTLLG
jgi:hypothetical protein